MNYIEYYKISDFVVDNLIFVLKYLNENNIGIPHNFYDTVTTVNAFQTYDLCRHDGDRKEFDQILNNILIEIGKPELKVTTFHMITYDSMGYQDEHSHENQTELISAVGTFVLYLSDCKSGATVFKTESGELEVLPKRGLLVWFPIDMKHYAKEVIGGDLKMIAVGSCSKIC